MTRSGTYTASSAQVAELQKELADVKDKLKVVTNKFANTRKERD